MKNTDTNKQKEDQPDQTLKFIKENAEGVIQVLGPFSGMDFGYNGQSVVWLEGFIEERRLSGSFQDEDMRNKWAWLYGSFLGECIVHCYGGTWAKLDDGSWWVRFDSGAGCYPLEKILKQMKNGLEDSIAGFFHFIPVMLAAQAQLPQLINANDPQPEAILTSACAPTQIPTDTGAGRKAPSNWAEVMAHFNETVKNHFMAKSAKAAPSDEKKSDHPQP